MQGTPLLRPAHAMGSLPTTASPEGWFEKARALVLTQPLWGLRQIFQPLGTCSITWKMGITKPTSQGMGRPQSPRRAGAQCVHWKCLAHRGIISGVPHVTPSRDPLSPPDRREVKSQLERACSCLTEPPSSSDPGTCIGPYGSHEPLLRLLPFLECLPYSQHFPSEGLFSESHHASPWRLDPSQPVPLPHHNLACGVHPHSCPQRWTQLRWGH